MVVKNARHVLQVSSCYRNSVCSDGIEEGEFLEPKTWTETFVLDRQNLVSVG